MRCFGDLAVCARVAFLRCGRQSCQVVATSPLYSPSSEIIPVLHPSFENGQSRDSWLPNRCHEE